MLFIFGAEKQDMAQIKSISDMKTNRKQLSEKKTGAQSRLNGFFSNMCVCVADLLACVQCMSSSGISSCCEILITLSDFDHVLRPFPL